MKRSLSKRVRSRSNASMASSGRLAPTPALDELIEMMPTEIPAGDEEASYFEGGRVSPEAVAKLFSAARLLFGLEPWKMAHDGQVLRMDIPALGVDGACVSIIGALGAAIALNAMAPLFATASIPISILGVVLGLRSRCFEAAATGCLAIAGAMAALLYSDIFWIAFAVIGSAVTAG